MDPTEQAQDAIGKLEAALGDVFPRIMAKHGRRNGGRRSRAHRLALAVSEWKAANDRNEADIIWAVELDIAAQVFNRWKGHAIWEREIRPALVNPVNYPHALFTLVAAETLGAEPVMAEGGERLADLYVPSTDPDRQPFRAEVKCPLELQAPMPDLSGDKARKVVQKCVSGASSRKGGQLDAEEPVILVVGGFHMNREQVAAVTLGAERELNAVRRANLPGILLLHWFCVVHGLEEENGRRRLQAGAIVHGVLRKQWIPNPTHDGRLGMEIVPNGYDFNGLVEHSGTLPDTG